MADTQNWMESENAPRRQDRKRTLTVLINKQPHYSTLWSQIRVASTQPVRRSHHSACTWKDRIFVFGGQDLNEGVYNDFWALQTNKMNKEDELWEQIITEGGPPKLCRHTALVHQNKMYIFGGEDLVTENNITYVFDFESGEWDRIIPTEAGLPPPIDSHSAVLWKNGDTTSMVVFGGYIGGNRSNQMFKLDLGTHQWTRCSGNAPIAARSLHSAIEYKDSMYVFGGQGENSEPFGDLWRMDLHSDTWELLQPAGAPPAPRSGHTVNAVWDCMVIFGGLLEGDQETNQLYSYNMTDNMWGLIQFEHVPADPVTEKQVEEWKKDKPQKIITPFGGNTQAVFKRKMLYNGPVEPSLGRVRTIMPHPRDGHTCTLLGEEMIIFGGDRHQFPFNDLYAYSTMEDYVKTPLSAKNM